MYHRYFSILHSRNLFLIFHQKWYFPRKVCLSFRLKKKCVGFIFSSTYLCIFFTLKIYLKIFIDDILRWLSLSTGMGPSPRTHGWADLHGGWNDYLDDIYNPIVYKTRDLDSVGAVGAAAPTDFEESSFCTLDFHTKIALAISFGAYLKICTQFWNPNRPLYYNFHYYLSV